MANIRDSSVCFTQEDTRILRVGLSVLSDKNNGPDAILETTLVKELNAPNKDGLVIAFGSEREKRLIGFVASVLCHYAIYSVDLVAQEIQEMPSAQALLATMFGTDWYGHNHEIHQLGLYAESYFNQPEPIANAECGPAGDYVW